MRRNHLLAAFAVLLAASVAPVRARAAEDISTLIRDAQGTVATFKRVDPSLAAFLERSAGYAVFPTVGKGAALVGGAYGSGVVFDRAGKPLGKATLTQVTVGLQLGGQAYSEIIVFETPRALEAFKSGEFAFATQASAVALSAGASASAKYRGGVAVFTAAKGGLMFEASIGGQKFG